MEREELKLSIDFRDNTSTMNKEGKRIWMYPKKPGGIWHNRRVIIAIVLIALFFITPFLKYNSEPFFLFNFTERKFILAGIIFWPQDFILLGLAMVTFFVFIISFTVVFGRLWCGWACPHTILTEMVFRKIEYLIEGDAAEQKRLNKAKWNGKKILKKGSKYLLFALIAILFSTFLVSYVIGIEDTLGTYLNYAEGWKIKSSILTLAIILFLVFAWFREQACIVVCPYGRLQSVLLDNDSVIVAYDHKRGEPRNKFRKILDENYGDCIDCYQCVKVCPTGIDIRNGTQLECINCTTCIDICDQMMVGVGRQKGLIKYSSEKNIIEGRKTTITTRMKAYAAVFIILSGILSLSLIQRSEVEGIIMRTPGLLYQETQDRNISNLYRIKLINKTNKYLKTVLKLKQSNGKIKMVGKDTIDIEPAGIGQAEFFIIISGEIKKRRTMYNIEVVSEGKILEKLETNFMGPLR